MKNVHILVVGCGSIGQRHARLLGERPELDLSVCDPLEANREQAAKDGRAADTFASFDEALECGADAALIASPNKMHAQQAIRAMQAGMDVLLEKPMTDTVEEAEQVNAAAREAGRVLMIGYNMRFHPALVEVKRRAQTGAVGNLVGGRAMVGSYFTLMCARTPFRLSEKNVLLLDYSHEFDFLGWIFGEVAEVTARTASLGKQEMRPEPNLSAAIFTYRSGAIVSVHGDYVQYPQRRITELYGDKATLALDLQTSVIEEYRMGREGAHVQHIPVFRDDLYRDEHTALFEAMTTRKPPISGEDGLAAMRVAEAVIESAARKQPVEL